MPPEKLLSCPFCGEEVVFVDSVFVNCRNIVHPIGKCILSCYSLPIDQWNTRTPSPELVELAGIEKGMERAAKIVSDLYDNSREVKYNDYKSGMNNGYDLAEQAIRTAIDAAKEKKP